MPYRTTWVPNEPVKTFNRSTDQKQITIYHAYDEDRFGDRLSYWFTRTEDARFEDAFAIQDLKAWKLAIANLRSLDPKTYKQVREQLYDEFRDNVLQLAIDMGELP